ncbi:MAG: nucleoside-diphosphate kinase [Candidatus Pacearchaeota archaeon]
MVYERTFAMIKPDGMKYKDEILKRIKEAGLRVVKSNIVKVSPDLAAKFYKHVRVNRGDQIYQSLIDYITSGEVMPMILEGENAVSVLRKITGNTDPEKAEKGTIRGDFGTDKMRIADSENRATRNVIHSSSSPDEAVIEINYFFKRYQK